MPAERGDTKLGRIFVRVSVAAGIGRTMGRGGNAANRFACCRISNRPGAKPMYLIRSRQVELEKRRRRQRGMGREFDSLREYREGDELRDISWTATARRRHLITRVFQMERSQNVWLVLDAGRLLRAQVREAKWRTAIFKIGLRGERRAFSGTGRSLLRRPCGFTRVWQEVSTEFVRGPGSAPRSSDSRMPRAGSRGSL